MRAFIVKLDNPSNKYEWFIKDFKVTSLEQILGFVSNMFYIELYDIKSTDNKDLINGAKTIVSAYEATAKASKEIITFLFDAVNILRSK